MVPAELRKANGTTSSLDVTFAPQEKGCTAEVTLKHGETLTMVGLPNDVDVVVEEMNHAGYTVSMNRTSGDNATVHFASGQSQLVECVNTVEDETPEPPVPPRPDSSTGPFPCWPCRAWHC